MNAFKAVSREEYFKAVGPLTHWDHETKFYGEPVKRYAESVYYVNRQPFCRRVSDMHGNEPTQYFLAQKETA
jgi:hypothetical protein